VLAETVNTAAFAAEDWLVCKGTVTTTIAQQSSTPADSERVLMLDGVNKRLYQWSERRKALNLIPAQSFTPDRVVWSTDLTNTGGLKWHGSLDRHAMVLGIERTDHNLDRMTWNEACQPTQSREPSAQAMAAPRAGPAG